MIAAEKTGRRGYGIELDPRYCDVIVKRMTGAFKVEAILTATGNTFNETERQRIVESSQSGPSDPIRENGASHGNG